MKKNLFLVVLIILSILTKNLGQQNYSFEEWSLPDKQQPFDWQDPVGWTSSNKLTEFFSHSVTKSNDAYSGQFAVKLSTINVFGKSIPASLTLGQGKINFPLQIISSEKAGIPLSDKIKKVNFYYKYETQSEPSNGSVEILVFRYNAAKQNRDTVFHIQKPLPSTSNFTSSSIDIDYHSLNNINDTLLIVFYSDQKMENEKLTGSLIIDELSLEFVSSLSETHTKNNQGKIFPNPLHAGEHLIVGDGQYKDGRYAIYSIQGVPIAKGNMAGSDIPTPVHLASGIYILRVSQGAHSFNRLITFF